MNWLITGGCGFIGRNLIKTLIAEKGHSLRVVDNLSVGTREDLETVCTFIEETNRMEKPKEGIVELIEGDILNAELALEVCEGIDTVVHLAGNTGVGPSVEDPRFDCVTNVIGTFNYLEGARKQKVSRFVFASSGAPAGECEPPVHEELPPHPVSPYGASKLAGEGYCSAYYKTYGLETVALRFSNVYGPLSSRKESVVAKFLRNIEKGVPLEIYGDGNQTRDFLYIDDLVKAVLLASKENEIGGEIFQIATGHETSVNWIAQYLIDVFEKIDPARSKGLSYLKPRVGDVMRNFADTTKAKNVLGWQPSVSLEAGLAETIGWLRSKQEIGF